MARLFFPSSFRTLFPGLPRRLDVEGATVGDLLRQLDQRWPGAWERLCSAGPSLRPHITIFVDGDGASIATPVREASEVHIVPAVSGG